MRKALNRISTIMQQIFPEETRKNKNQKKGGHLQKEKFSTGSGCSKTLDSRGQ